MDGFDLKEYDLSCVYVQYVYAYILIMLSMYK